MKEKSLWHSNRDSVVDLMANLLESKKIILVTVVLDAIVLIIFGSFLLSRVLVKPIKDLVQLTQKISEGISARKLRQPIKMKSDSLSSPSIE